MAVRGPFVAALTYPCHSVPYIAGLEKLMPALQAVQTALCTNLRSYRLRLGGYKAQTYSNALYNACGQLKHRQG